MTRPGATRRNRNRVVYRCDHKCKPIVDDAKVRDYTVKMIRSFRHKGLEELFRTGGSAKVGANLKSRILRRLDALQSAAVPAQVNVPGFNFHALKGVPQRYTVHVNGPWCITFGWDGADAIDLDLEQYH